jgi:ABC-2 type transport system permease protein
MKLAILRNSTTGGRAAWMVVGAVLGLAAAATTIGLAFAGAAGATGEAGDLLACAGAVWLLGWVAGPLLGGSPVLRPGHFALLPLPRRRLAAGLLASAFVGVPGMVTAVAFLGLLPYGLRLGPWAALTALPAAVLTLILVVLLSRVAYAYLGAMAGSRPGAALTGVLLGALITLTQSGWIVVVAITTADGLSPGFPAALRVVPSGWGVAAVDAAGRGDGLTAIGVAAGLAVLDGALLLAWARSLGAPTRARATVRGSAHGVTPTRGGPAEAVYRKELRTWWRDPQQWAAISLPLAWALLTVLLPLLFGEKVLLPWAGTALALFAVTAAGNVYGHDGTALWLTLMTATQRADVRGRQWAYLTVFGPIAVVLAVGGTLWSGHTWAWPWVAATVPALLGGGAGLTLYASVLAMAPGPDAHRRPDNPLDRPDNTGPAYVLFWVALLPPLPAAGMVALGTVFDNPVLLWAGGPLGLATGIVIAWWLGNAAITRLTARGPEMLTHLRTGKAPAPTPEPPPETEGRPQALIMGCLVLGSILLFPQGLVPAIFLSSGVEARVWFLPMYLPAAWGAALAALFVVTGALLWLKALRAILRPAKAQADQ